MKPLKSIPKNKLKLFTLKISEIMNINYKRNNIVYSIINKSPQFLALALTVVLLLFSKQEMQAQCPTIDSITTTNPLCNGGAGSATINASGGTAPLTYTWSNSTNGISATNLSTGVYTVTVTDANSCSATSTFTITEPAPIINSIIQVQKVSCGMNNGILTVIASGGAGGFSYSWNTGQTGPTVNNVTAGTYSVTVTDQNNCAGISTIELLKDSIPTINAGADQTICLGMSVQLNAVATLGLTYSWLSPESLNDPTFPNPISTPTITTTYTVIVTNSYGCTATDEITITVSAPLINISPDQTICNGGSTQLAAGGGVAYLWSPAATLDDASIFNPIASPTITTTYTVLATDGNGCPGIKEVTVTVSPICGDSIWPGDANNNTVADNYDLLTLGLGYGQTGPARTAPTINWVGQVCNNWTNTLLPNNTNEKFADCNGDGTIDANDTTAIINNYGLMHNLKLGVNQYLAGLPDLYVQVPNDTIYSSDVISVPVFLGNNASQANNVYGLAFSINFDAAIIDSSKSSFILNNTSWLGTPNTQVISIHKSLPSQNRIDIALTRIDHANASGYGQIGTAVFVLKDDVLAKMAQTRNLELAITGTTVISNNGTPIDVNSIGDGVVVVQKDVLSSVNTYKSAKLKTVVYPNPATNQLNVLLETSGVSTIIRLLNSLGEVVYEINTTENKTTIDLNTISKGIYMLNVVNATGIANERITVVK